MVDRAWRICAYGWARWEIRMSVEILIGDSRDVLATMPDQSVHCIVTSPPYFGLRDYGVDGQMGLEPTPDEYVAGMVALFREARRVLRDDGTLWLNLGDSYAGSGRGGNPEAGTKQGTNKGSQSVGVLYGREQDDAAAERERVKSQNAALAKLGLKPKDLIGIPWAVAKALQAPFYTGKIKNESDRAWLAAIIDGEGCFFIHKRKAGSKSYSKFSRADGSEADYLRSQDTYGPGLEISNTNKDLIERVASIVPGGTYTEQTPDQNNRRRQTIYRWRLAPNAAKELAREIYPHLVAKQHQARLLFNCPSTGDAAAYAHQAMMDLHRGLSTDVDYPAPPSLFEPGWWLRQDIIWSKSNPMPESVRDRCTKAHEYVFMLSKSPRYYFDSNAMQEDAVTSVPSKHWKDREYDQSMLASQQANGVKGRPIGVAGYTAPGKRNRRSVWTVTTKPFKGAHFATFPPDLIEPCILACCPVAGTVLDPFFGAGTTGLVAQKHGRNCIGIELNPEYAALARERIDAPPVKPKKRKPAAANDNTVDLFSVA